MRFFSKQKETNMKKQFGFTAFFVVTGLLAGSVTVYGQDLATIKLAAPQTEGGKPFMQTLKNRKSIREFGAKDLSLQMLSDLLWAANGINRPQSGYRTAPSTMNMQEIDVYVAKAGGVYLFDAKANVLTPVAAGDLRALTGKQGFVKDAPVNLIFVADMSKMGKLPPADAESYACMDAGFVSENVYLFCASNDLATVVRGLVDKPALAKALKLKDNQKIILAQTVGYPK
jgi:SagB-type dehydrogenase family enzyme